MQHAAMNLKHRLRQIETDECRGHRIISVMKGTYPLRGTDVPDAGGRPSHHADLNGLSEPPVILAMIERVHNLTFRKRYDWESKV
jgi:hypothetical protein